MKQMEQVSAQFNKFIITLSILTALLLTLFIVAFEVAHIAEAPKLVYGFFPYFFILTAFIHHTLLKANQQKSNQFVNKFSGLLGLKMFLSAAVIGVCAYIYKEQMNQIVTSFLILYFSYTGVEITAINKAVRSKPKPDSE
ncbi:hypothetical protein R9C00_21545 [Flammeovirgaceae bacterium SG7u.111]|nr:hypothetical protein [Flammeovirgaceae bacterium SG7u.132]WPO34287.1 hypothetical protein R9C00_21545 [Flammeovirgaceae bacterium SG7u.111]